MNEDKSDFEINKAVAEALGILKDNVDIVGCGDSIELFDFDGSFFINYCKNPSDAWPIIFDNRITTYWAHGENWSATITNQGQAGAFKKFQAYDENPLRAAMIVFLKMQEDKQ